MGRKAGISKEEYLSLIKLNKKDFEYREWVALTYAREWAYAKGIELSIEFSEEFRILYSQREQALIIKLLRMMLFANYCGNSYFKRPWKGGIAPQACEVTFDTTEKNLKD